MPFKEEAIKAVEEMRSEEAARIEGKLYLKHETIEGDLIEFYEHPRICGYNTEAMQDGRPLLKDYHVVINGERRALLSQYDRGSRAYQIYDADHRGIHLGNDGNYIREHQGTKIDGKNQFVSTVLQAMRENKIPTLTDLANRRLEKARQEEEAKRLEAERKREEHIKDCGPELLKALEVSLDMLNQLLLAAEQGVVPDISIGFFKNRTEIIEPAVARAKAGPL